MESSEQQNNANRFGSYCINLVAHTVRYRLELYDASNHSKLANLYWDEIGNNDLLLFVTDHIHEGNVDHRFIFYL